MEKEALVGVIEGICREFRVPYYAHTGYASVSDLHTSGQRFADYVDDMRSPTPIVLALGDHDPEGLDITRSLKERLDMYSGESLTPDERDEDLYSIEPGDIEVRRIGLTKAQVDHYRLPANFAKEKSARFAGYWREFGTNKCWELDALPPPVLVGLIRDELDSLIDREEWRKAQRAEERNRRKLVNMAKKLI